MRLLAHGLFRFMSQTTTPITSSGNATLCLYKNHGFVFFLVVGIFHDMQTTYLCFKQLQDDLICVILSVFFLLLKKGDPASSNQKFTTGQWQLPSFVTGKKHWNLVFCNSLMAQVLSPYLACLRYDIIGLIFNGIGELTISFLFYFYGSNKKRVGDVGVLNICHLNVCAMYFLTSPWQ